MRNIDTTLLRAFVAVAETGGMTSAGHILHLTQAAVSQQIKRLEESFDCVLFDRSRGGMRLTVAGERLLGRAQRLLALNDEIWAEMTTPLFEGEVRLGVPSDVVGAYVPVVLKSFARAYPKVRISLECAPSLTLLTRLKAGEIDLTLTTEEGCGPDGETLFTERLLWVGARGGEAYRQRPLPVVIGSDACTFHRPVTRALAAADIPWRSVSEVVNTGAQVATTQADLAVMALLASTVPSPVEILPPEAGLPALPTFSVNLYLPRTGSTEIARELARHVRDMLLERQRLAA